MSNVEKDQNKNGKKNHKKHTQNKDIFKLIKMIMEREFDPCIVFAFSRREVESLALSLSKLDFCSLDEKKLICRIFNNAISTLNDKDKRLPQIQSLIHLLQRGVGIHHSGLLPILILFGEGLIRVLCTTETFAMGVNFPAKTVIFSNVKKWDGMNHRLLTSGEYIQMSGRAGRRGLDQRGIVIMIANDKLEPFELQNMLKGKSDRLLSQFHITYPMVMQLQRLEDVKVTYIVNRSFMQFQKLEKIPNLQAKLSKIQIDIDTNYKFESKEQETKIEKYFLLQKSLNQLYVEMIAITNKPKHILPWLNPGRLLFISQPMLNQTIGWCVCLNYKKISKRDLEILQAVHKNKNLKINYIVDVLTPKNQIISVQLHHIQRLSGIRLNMEKFKNLTIKDSKMKLSLILNECLKRNSENLQELHPIKHLNINDQQLVLIYEKIEVVKEKIKNHIESIDGHESMDIDEMCIKYKKKKDLELEIVAIENEIVSLQNNEHIQKRLNGMNRVLRRLKMIDNDVITMKGKIVCEISSGDQLILTELLFSNLFNQISSAEYVNALLSCFIFDEVKEKKVSDQMNEENYKKLKKKILAICEIEKECKLDKNTKKYLESFSFGLMDVALAWSKGAQFQEIAKMTSVYEGTIIRVLKRLDELLAEMVECGKLIGNETLTNTFIECREKIKRDIVFSASLYL